ncbi:MAG: elongation factor P maturation arginine rhamnosyltransferase EarP [Treponema sp.]|nr:elongation factor P maturation arginine rhamnosyltransferase EarP [Treponema sp.]
MQTKEITLLCKVVDNCGDIGVVYRLARAISDIDSTIQLNIICSDLQSFAAMNSAVDKNKKLQKIEYKVARWTIIEWNITIPGLIELNGSLPDFGVILECFQCGRPDFLEDILFDKNNTKLYRIINVEYLTAEDYAEEFHCLKSGTRSALVKKVNFMPGFTAKTGGMILDKAFMDSLAKAKLAPRNADEFTVPLFSYERDFTAVFKALIEFQALIQQKNPDFKVKVLAADGKSLPYAKKAQEATGSKLEFTALPFMAQGEWDALLCRSDFNFIRGEDSLSRACLCSKPFFWHAYVQEDNYQLVKVEAVLNKLVPYISDEKLGQNLRRQWLNYNTPDKELDRVDLVEIFLASYEGKLTADFAHFSKDLLLNGNLAMNLLNYIKSL